MEFLQEYIVLVVVGICLCVGYVLKNLISAKAIHRFIPLAMGLLGAFLNVWVAGWRITPEILLAGMVSGLASTGLYELFRNFIEKKQ